ncbi:zinc transporter-domain containing protein [Nitzschia inconspicua]|uniref:Zinc transporter-domain containing protein n=1 Tax=Nitzschia inconspicua TaxID=303405 RepID=A0A9K3M799_9STRA|nr:zinc transporter-domain containing protein [Nitzschia inconspicua]
MSRNENAGVAFGVVLAASASTGLGAAVVFFPSLVKLANRRVLAMSLGFSAGVMTYVSFAEIFGKAQDSFRNDGHDESRAYIYATCCFFGGVLCMMLLNVAVHSLLGVHGHGHDHDHHVGDVATSTTTNCKKKKKKKPSTRESVNRDIVQEDVGVPATAPCCSSDPVHQLQTFQRMASVLEHEQQHNNNNNNDDQVEQESDTTTVVIVGHENIASRTETQTQSSPNKEEEEEEKSQDSNCNQVQEEEEEEQDVNSHDDHHHDHDDHDNPNKQQQLQDDKTAAPSDMLDENSETNKKLERMGIKTAIAIGLHNFPEGLATFVAALEDPAVGAVLAVAIAIHNIPEGLCVALPVYYATGNRLKAFLWAVLSGASELVAALLGWVILANVIGDTTYAILFGLVSGMMVIISVKELLPTAHQYDPQDTVVTYSFIAGMALMAFSLVMFQL